MYKINPTTQGLKCHSKPLGSEQGTDADTDCGIKIPYKKQKKNLK